MELRRRLNELARNLYWTWHSEVYHIFQDLDPQLWRELSRNPLAFLGRLSDDYLEKRTKILALRARITRAYYTLRDYLEDEDTWGRQHSRSLRDRQAEMKLILEKGMPALTSNGVLGDPRTATAEKGEDYLERFAEFVISEIGAKPAARPRP